MINKIAEIYYKYDPGALAASGAPRDEYTSEAQKLLDLYQSGEIKSADDVANVLKVQLGELYDANSTVESIDVSELTEEIWKELSSRD